MDGLIQCRIFLLGLFFTLSIYYLILQKDGFHDWAGMLDFKILLWDVG